MPSTVTYGEPKKSAKRKVMSQRQKDSIYFKKRQEEMAANKLKDNRDISDLGKYTIPDRKVGGLSNSSDSDSFVDKERERIKRKNAKPKNKINPYY